jgi:hypothetical protein
MGTYEPDGEGEGEDEEGNSGSNGNNGNGVGSNGNNGGQNNDDDGADNVVARRVQSLHGGVIPSLGIESPGSSPGSKTGRNGGSKTGKNGNGKNGKGDSLNGGDSGDTANGGSGKSGKKTLDSDDLNDDDTWTYIDKSFVDSFRHAFHSVEVFTFEDYPDRHRKSHESKRFRKKIMMIRKHLVDTIDDMNELRKGGELRPTPEEDIEFKLCLPIWHGLSNYHMLYLVKVMVAWANLKFPIVMALAASYINAHVPAKSLGLRIVNYQMMRALLADLLSPLEAGSLKGVKNIFAEIADKEKADREQKEKAEAFLTQKSPEQLAWEGKDLESSYFANWLSQRTIIIIRETCIRIVHF